MTTRLPAEVFIGSVMVLLLPEAALAYGGPGSVITGIGAFLAAVVAIAAAVLDFFWFPVRRLYQKLTGEELPEEREVADVP